MKRNKQKAGVFAFEFVTDCGAFLNCEADGDPGDPGDYDTPPEPASFTLTSAKTLGHVELIHLLAPEVIQEIEAAGIAKAEEQARDGYDDPTPSDDGLDYAFEQERDLTP